MLGLMVDGAPRCIELARDNKSVIDVELQKIVCTTKGVPFNKIETFTVGNDTAQEQEI